MTWAGAQIVVIARRVLDEQKAGRSVDPLRLEWAEHIVRANTPAEPQVGTDTRATRARFVEAAQ